MANKHTTLKNLFTDIASAIREKTGGTVKIVADDFPDEIRKIITISNGRKWNQSNVTSIYANKIYYSNGIWIAYGGNLGIYYSNDGITWNQVEKR